MQGTSLRSLRERLTWRNDEPSLAAMAEEPKGFGSTGAMEGTGRAVGWAKRWSDRRACHVWTYRDTGIVLNEPPRPHDPVRCCMHVQPELVMQLFDKCARKDDQSTKRCSMPLSR